MQLTFGNMIVELNISKLMKHQFEPEEFPSDESCLIKSLVQDHIGMNVP